MENIEMLKLNNISTNTRDYSAMQMILPLELGKKLEKNDPVYSFLEVMEGVNWYQYLNKPTNKGRKEYNPFNDQSRSVCVHE